jgi:NADH:ubiquinone reductase (H+-translocating)
MTSEAQPIVVIVGAGFGGLNAARSLSAAPVKVILIDRNNYHLFQPLLYQVATAGLAPSEIAYPVRAIFRRQRNFEFRMAEMTGVDLEKRIVHTPNYSFPYDYLVLAPGGETNYFGLESVEQNGFAMKALDDSIGIRNHLFRVFEKSMMEDDHQICQALRTFVVVGGGPTGVELAGSVAELIRLVLVKDFPGLNVDDVRVMVLEATGSLLPGFPPDLAESAVKTLRRKHVEVCFNATVEHYDGHVVRMKGGDEIPAYTVVWAAGVRAIPLLGRIGLPTARQGRVIVERTLQVREHPEVFVIGDAAYLEDEGQPLPMVAPVAIQQAKTAAANIKHMLAGVELEKFVYKDPGSLATIGRSAAVARVGRFKFRGFVAWVVWLAVHLFWLIGFRNRLLVLINWAADYIFYERAVRLITKEAQPGAVEAARKRVESAGSRNSV